MDGLFNSLNLILLPPFFYLHCLDVENSRDSSRMAGDVCFRQAFVGWGAV